MCEDLQWEKKLNEAKTSLGEDKWVCIESWKVGYAWRMNVLLNWRETKYRYKEKGKACMRIIFRAHFKCK